MSTVAVVIVATWAFCGGIVGTLTWQESVENREALWYRVVTSTWLAFAGGGIAMGAGFCSLALLALPFVLIFS